MVAHQLFDIVDQILSVGARVFVFPRIHSNGVARAGLHAKPAKNTAEFIDRKHFGAFLHRFVFTFFGDDFNAIGRANGLA